MTGGADLRAWIGRTERRADVLHAGPAAALAATLDDPWSPATGDVLPPLWHWAYFVPHVLRRELGDDGHARRGSFLPPVPLPRRMWAAGAFTFARPMRIGERLSRTSSIDDVVEKSGRSGKLAFVRVRHAFHDDAVDDPVMVEHQTIVYREASTTGSPPPDGLGDLPRSRDATWRSEVIPDDVLLFRYSAVTFNGHRIHYDRRYATAVEGYPGLVVHGPLVATLLLELVRRERPRARVRAFEFRAVRPLFDTARFMVAGVPSDDGRTVRLWAEDPSGAVALDASAELEG